MKFNYEVLIVGGGPAGISAAMTLGRMSRSALIVDDHRPRNAPSSHLNNFATRDGIHPKEWLRLARKDLEKYQTIKTLDGTVLSVDPESGGFRARISSGVESFVKKVILAYGVKDKLPPIPGFKELWGQAIFHCPFCHGFEIRGSKLGFMISNEMGFHQLPMIQSLTSELVVFTNGRDILTQEHRQLFKEKKVTLFENKITRLEYSDKTLKSIELADSQKVKVPFLFYNAEMPFELKSGIGEQLGCKKNQFGFYEVNEMSATSTPNIFAAGDNMSMGHTVLLACASGVKAGMGVIGQLMMEQS